MTAVPQPFTPVHIGMHLRGGLHALEGDRRDFGMCIELSDLVDALVQQNRIAPIGPAKGIDNQEVLFIHGSALLFRVRLAGQWASKHSVTRREKHAA